APFQRTDRANEARQHARQRLDRGADASAGQPTPPRACLEDFEFYSEPGRCFPGRHQVRRRLEYLGREPPAALALSLEGRLVNGRSGFEPGELGFQRLDAGLERSGDRTMIVR